MGELKPCPFCGGKASAQFNGEYASPHSIRCGVCGASTGRDESEEYTGTRWARRCDEDHLTAEIAEQCRIIGMSGEREARLVTELDQARQDADTCSQLLAAANGLLDEVGYAIDNEENNHCRELALLRAVMLKRREVE